MPEARSAAKPFFARFTKNATARAAILSARKNTGTICLIRVNVIPLSSKKSNDNPSKYSIRTYTANAGALMNTVDQKAVLKLKRFSLKDLSMKNMHITMTDKDKRPAQMSSR